MPPILHLPIYSPIVLHKVITCIMLTSTLMISSTYEPKILLAWSYVFFGTLCNSKNHANVPRRFWYNYCRDYNWK